MRQYTAIILGGTEDHIHLVSLLKASGSHVVLCDHLNYPPAAVHADRHLRVSALDENRVADAARAFGADLVIATCIDQALPIMASVSHRLGLPCYLSIEQAQAFTNKAIMKERMASHGIPTARHAVIHATSKGRDAVRDFGYPVVIKPVDTNSSKGVVRVDNAQAWTSALAEAASHSRSGTLVIEEFMPGAEYSFDIVLVDGEPVVLGHSHLEKSPLLPNRFAITACTMPSPLSTVALDAVLAIAKRISRAYAYPNGVLLLQVIIDEHRVRVIEFSGRIGGGSKHHLIRHSCSIDLVKHVLDLTLGRNPQITEMHPPSDFWACHYAYGYNGTISFYEGLNQCREEGLLVDYFIYKTPGAAIEGQDSSAHRPFGFIVTGSSRDSLRDAVARVYRRVKVWSTDGRDLLIRDSIAM